MSYTTTSRTKILEYLEENSSKTVTVNNISEHLKENGCEVNVTTIYRFLDKLIDDEKVIKYVAEKGKQATFQYVENGHRCDEHLHLQCIKCGGITHLECDFMNEIAKHIGSNHGFKIQCKNSIIYGICKSCSLMQE